MDVDYAVLGRVIAATNQKGGVGKTTSVVNIGAHVASVGRTVLIVDLDPQGNVGLDLGYQPDPMRGNAGDPRYDNGKGLSAALTLGTDPVVLHGVRSHSNGGRIDVIPAGSALKTTPVVLAYQAVATREPYDNKLAELLMPIAGDYDLILIDCPPSDMVLRALALHAARYALAPTRSDRASWQAGIESLVSEIKLARSGGNPQLRLIGTFLFGTSAAPKLQRTTREAIATCMAQWFQGDPYGIPPVFETSIRFAESVAATTRLEGKTAAEVASQAQHGPTSLELLMRARAGEDVSGITVAPGGTSNVATDYARLAVEILTAVFQSEKAAVPAGLSA